MDGRREKAKQFDSFTEAMEFWRRQSTVHPFRLSDGKPNRPLCAYSVTVVNLDNDTPSIVP